MVVVRNVLKPIDNSPPMATPEYLYKRPAFEYRPTPAKPGTSAPTQHVPDCQSYSYLSQANDQSLSLSKSRHQSFKENQYSASIQISDQQRPQAGRQHQSLQDAPIEGRGGNYHPHAPSQFYGLREARQGSQPAKYPPSQAEVFLSRPACEEYQCSARANSLCHGIQAGRDKLQYRSGFEKEDASPLPGYYFGFGRNASD